MSEKYDVVVIGAGKRTAVSGPTDRYLSELSLLQDGPDPIRSICFISLRQVFFVQTHAQGFSGALPDTGKTIPAAVIFGVSQDT